MSKDMYWIRSGLINVGQNLSGVLFGFASFYLLVRLLDKHDFGAWTLFMSATTVLELIRGGLVQNALVKYLAAAEKTEHVKIISASFTISGSLTVLCIIINLCFAHYLGKIWNSPELEPIFHVYTIGFFLSGILTQFNCIEQANLKFTGIFFSFFVRQSVFFCYVFICFLFKIEILLINLVYIQILTVTAGVIISYFYVRPYLSISFKIYREWIKKLFNYGKYAFGTSISSILSGTIDQMMLGSLLSPAASGAFNIAVRITNLIDIPTNAIATIVFPQGAKRLESDGIDAIKYLYERSVGVLLSILVPGIIFMFIFSDYLVTFIAGERYKETIPLLHITLMYCLLIPYGRQLGTILDASGKTKLNFFIVLTTASINIGLNYPLILYYGVMGAAYASLISNIIGFVIGQIILRRMAKVNLFNTLIYAVNFYPEFYHKYIRPKKKDV